MLGNKIKQNGKFVLRSWPFQEMEGGGGKEIGKDIGKYNFQMVLDASQGK